MPTYRLKRVRSKVPTDVKDLTEKFEKFSVSNTVDKENFIWPITDVDLSEFVGTLKSPKFSISANGSIKCQIVLKKEKCRLIIVRPKFLGFMDENADVKIDLNFLNKYDKPIQDMYCWCEDHSIVPYIGILKRDLKDCKVTCSIKIQIPKLDPQMSFMHLFDNEKLIDFRIKVGDVVFPVHKVLMAHFSPVFSTLFASDTIESQENMITVTDFEPDIFKALLDFIYSGRVENINDIAIELYQLAHKYMVTKLCLHCVDVMLKSIDEDNVEDILLLAEVYGENELKKFAQECINDSNEEKTKKEKGANKLRN